MHMNYFYCKHKICIVHVSQTLFISDLLQSHDIPASMSSFHDCRQQFEAYTIISLQQRASNFKIFIQQRSCHKVCLGEVAVVATKVYTIYLFIDW